MRAPACGSFAGRSAGSRALGGGPAGGSGVPAFARAGRRPGGPHRQRPATAKGVTFINLEDETGSLNVTCSVGLFARYRQVAISSSALLVRGLLERSPEGVLNLGADRLQKLPLTVEIRSRDFR